MIDYEDNSLCEICISNRCFDDYRTVTFDLYWINTHCIELRQNRKARENKNFEPTNTVF